jgi:hypothetical protein
MKRKIESNIIVSCSCVTVYQLLAHCILASERTGQRFDGSSAHKIDSIGDTSNPCKVVATSSLYDDDDDDECAYDIERCSKLLVMIMDTNACPLTFEYKQGYFYKLLLL